jgi:subtilase family serine protease
MVSTTILGGAMKKSRRGSRSRRACTAIALAAIAVLLGSAHGARAGAGTVTLGHDVVRQLGLATLLGPVSSSQPVTVGVFLANPNQGDEDAYVKQLYDPASANYRNFLDPDTFDQRFGVPAADMQATQAWLQAGGLTVTSVEGSTEYALATGSAAQVEALFATALNRYAVSGRTFYANTLAPSVPASLGVAKVLGLNDLNRFATPRVSAPVRGTTVAAPSVGTVPNTGLLGPKDLWSIYDLPSTNLGNGQSMAIFGWGVTDPVVPDLRSFEAEWNLPQVPVTTKYYGDTSTPDTSGDGATGEWELDTQASTGMAPNVVAETLYFAHHNTDADTLAAFTAWVNDRKGPLQASASFGECENVGNAGALLTDGMEVPGDKILERAVIEGRTLFTSTGDTGSSCPVVPVNTNGVATQGYPGLEWPSVSPWAVAVGGTDLTSDGGNPPKRLTETAWEYTGGGNSTSEPAGSYQQGVATTNCLFDADGNPYVPGATAAGPICRSTPDVAAISGDVATGNGMLVTNDSGADQQGAGTSLSSPLWLGMWTRVQAAASGRGLGFADYSLYALGKSSPGRDFYDVTVGDNQPYPAKPGYDNTTGWGTPEVSQIMLDLTGRLTPTKNTAPAAASTTPTTTCGSLFSDPAGDDSYAIEGQTLAAQGTSPQLDILGGRIQLSSDGQTLRTIITVRNLPTTIPTGGLENDYNLVWTLGSTTYFTQLAVEPTGTVQAYDGQLLRVSLENRYQQLHVDTGAITLGPNGTVEVDVPLANLPGVMAGTVLQHPSAATYVREGAVAGSLEPVDAAGPTDDYVAGGC